MQPIPPPSFPPTVSENGAHTAKSTTAKSNSSNGSYGAYATPTVPTFLSATLPPLTSHQVSPHIPPPLILHHYEVDENRQSHVYDQPGQRAATMPPPLPYEVPMVSVCVCVCVTLSLPNTLSWHNRHPFVEHCFTHQHCCFPGSSVDHTHPFTV